jgi:hypothetical protein
MRYALHINQSTFKGLVTMQAYFIKCINKQLGTEAMSTRLFYFYDQVIEIVDTLNAKQDGYEYFIHQANI